MLAEVIDFELSDWEESLLAAFSIKKIKINKKYLAGNFGVQMVKAFGEFQKLPSEVRDELSFECLLEKN